MKMALNSLSSCISIGRSFDSRVLRVIVSKHRIKEHHGFFRMKMTLNPHSPSISIGRSFNSRVPRPILRLANVGSGSQS